MNPIAVLIRMKKVMRGLVSSIKLPDVSIRPLGNSREMDGGASRSTSEMGVRIALFTLTKTPLYVETPWRGHAHYARSEWRARCWKLESRRRLRREPPSQSP